MAVRKNDVTYQATTRVFNATLEKHMFQIHSQPLIFEPCSYLDVPDVLIRDLVRMKPGYGLVVCYGDEDFDFEKAKRQALLDYIGPSGRLGKRIKHYKEEKEWMLKYKQFYNEEPFEFKKAVSFDKEIRNLLNEQQIIDEIPSFKDFISAEESNHETMPKKTKKKTSEGDVA